MESNGRTEMADVWFLKYMWVWRDHHQGDMASHQHEELELSPSCTGANSVVLETGETGLVLTLIYTHEPRGFHREESLPDCGSGAFSEKKAEIETGICSFTHYKEQASLPSPLLDMRKVGYCAKWNKLERRL